MRIQNVDQVVRDALPRSARGLGRPDIESSVDLESVGIDDLPDEPFGQLEGKGTLADRRRPHHDQHSLH